MNLSPSLLVSIPFWNVLLLRTPNAMSAAAFTTATTKVRVKGSGVESVNTEYEWTEATIVPPGFETVCRANGWGVKNTWDTLNNGKPWLRAASNEAYIYLNNADGQWWIDKPDGAGVFVAPSSDGNGHDDGPPTTGWRALSPSYKPEPSLEIVVSDVTNRN